MDIGLRNRDCSGIKAVVHIMIVTSHKVALYNPLYIG